MSGLSAAAKEWMTRADRIHVDELNAQFGRMETSLFYRLEQLRLLGFIQRIELNESRDDLCSDGRCRIAIAAKSGYSREH